MSSASEPRRAIEYLADTFRSAYEPQRPATSIFETDGPEDAYQPRGREEPRAAGRTSMASLV
jgi:hypothetical protein